MAELKTNLLYFGDNLEWLSNQGHFPDESVDLVYLDPPFNSNRNYNVLFKESDVRESEAQIHAFEDTWHWDREGRVQDQYNRFVAYGPEKAGKLLRALVDALGHNDVTAYLTMMAPRLVEMHRVLKPTGSLYLHCDPTASHYLKVLLDSIFGAARFRNEIVWRRTASHNSARRFGPIHDTLLFYGKGDRPTFNPVYRPYLRGHVDGYFQKRDDRGRYWTNALTGDGIRRGESGQPWLGYDPTARNRHWAIPSRIVDELGLNPEMKTLEKLDALYSAGFIVLPSPNSEAMPTYRQYLDNSPGAPLQDVWAYQPHTSGVLYDSDEEIDRDVRWLVRQGDKERLGYETQKPLGLLERIINASSNSGDVVLDPFCGCGTAVHAAQKLGRQWVGIDITPIATDLIRRRMEDAFPGLKVPIEGWPADFAGARSLAAQEDKYHFQDWAVIQAGGRPAGGERRKGADRGVDGVIPFIDGTDGPKRGIISVKAGNTGPSHVRDLAGVVTREGDATFGVFVCLNEPTRPMVEEALSHGSWTSTHDGNSYPVIQILSAQDLIDGKLPRMPQGGRVSPFARAARERNREGTQGRF